MKITNVFNQVFRGTTAIRAVTDSHQEARLESQLLSKIQQDAKKRDNILLLNCGDLFGGVYSRDLMADVYLKFKEQNPNVEIVMTIGNNDPISLRDKYAPKDPKDKRSSADFLKDTIKKFEQKGIHVVCANIKDKTTSEYPDWIKPYTIIERDGDRIFVTGFCIDRLSSKGLNVDVISQNEAINNLKAEIEKQKPDSIIVLNHDYVETSRSLFNFAKEKEIKIDLIVGGHEHNEPEILYSCNLYRPKAFGKSMYEMDLEIKNNVHKIMNAKEIRSGNLPVSEEFEAMLQPYEKQSGILDKVAPHTLNLPKSYAHPGSLGTFIADAVKETAHTDIAFFASGIVRMPLYYKENSDILNYDVRKIIIFDSTAQKAQLTPDELKEVLNSAFENRLKLGEQNARFLQCSSNVKIEGEGNRKNNTYSIKQIYIDNEPLFDEEGKAINPSKKINCAFDNYIPTDGRSKVLSDTDKEDVYFDGKKLRFDDALKMQLQGAQGKYKKGMTYPKFELIETITD